MIFCSRTLCRSAWVCLGSWNFAHPSCTRRGEAGVPAGTLTSNGRDLCAISEVSLTGKHPRVSSRNADPAAIVAQENSNPGSPR
jgi:hypothetical protein